MTDPATDARSTESFGDRRENARWRIAPKMADISATECTENTEGGTTLGSSEHVKLGVLGALCDRFVQPHAEGLAPRRGLSITHLLSIRTRQEKSCRQRNEPIHSEYLHSSECRPVGMVILRPPHMVTPMVAGGTHAHQEEAARDAQP